MNEKQATPREQLIQELLDSRVPKTEREHCAAREIESLRKRVKLLEDAMKYIFKETQNTGYGNAIVMERMIDRIEECAINALSNLSGEIDGN